MYLGQPRWHNRERTILQYHSNFAVIFSGEMISRVLISNQRMYTRWPYDNSSKISTFSKSNELVSLDLRLLRFAKGASLVG